MQSILTKKAYFLTIFIIALLIFGCIFVKLNWLTHTGPYLSYLDPSAPHGLLVSSHLLPTKELHLCPPNTVVSYSFPTTKDVLPRTAYFDNRAHNGHTNATVSHSFPTTKDILPRTAYFDNRVHNGHANATVILFEATKEVLYDKLVVGCGIENVKPSTDFKVINMEYGAWIHQKLFYKALTHQQGIAFCYDLPVQNGSRTFLVYRHKTSKSNITDCDTLVYTERPLHIEPKDTSKSNRILVCTTIFGQPPWFTAWLRYQKTIGVDFVHLYAQESFVEEGGMDNPQLREFIKQGFVKVDVWKAYLNDTELYYHSEVLMYQDCVLRYLNVFEYVFLYDTDDFFIPRMSDSSNISNYIKIFFNNKRVGSVQLEWPRYFADCGLTGEPDDIKDGNMTKILSSHKFKRDYIKSFHRLSAVLEAGVHRATSLMPGYERKDIKNSTAYVAHVRKYQKPHIC